MISEIVGKTAAKWEALAKRRPRFTFRRGRGAHLLDMVMVSTIATRRDRGLRSFFRKNHRDRGHCRKNCRETGCPSETTATFHFRSLPSGTQYQNLEKIK